MFQAVQELPDACPAAVRPLVIQAAVAPPLACCPHLHRRPRCEGITQQHSALEELRYQLVPACSARATALRAVQGCDLQCAVFVDHLHRADRCHRR